MNNDRLKEGYKQTAIGLIPEDWDVVPLGSFLNFQNGVNASKASYGHGIPFINISEVMAHTHPAIPNSKKLGGVGGLRGWRAVEHKINQRLPTLKAEILSQAHNILKETFASTALLTNLLVSLIR
jgi:hypothetical protein